VKTLVLPDRIELSTSPLPRECSTTELRQHRAKDSSQDGSIIGRSLPQGPLRRKRRRNARAGTDYIGGRNRLGRGSSDRVPVSSGGGSASEKKPRLKHEATCYTQTKRTRLTWLITATNIRGRAATLITRCASTGSSSLCAKISNAANRRRESEARWPVPARIRMQARQMGESKKSRAIRYDRATARSGASKAALGCKDPSRLHWCRGSEVLVIGAASRYRELLNQSGTGNIDFANGLFESEVR
jgi:hypothetical protein